MIDPLILARVPGCGEGNAPRVQRRLPGGRGCNDIHYLETAAGRFVLRQRLAPVLRPGAAPLQELRCHAAAANAGLAPGIIAAADDGHWILMEWLDGRQWHDDDLTRVSVIERLGERLAMLHALPPPQECAPLAPLDLARTQCSLIETRKPAALAEAYALLKFLEVAADELAACGPGAVLCHGDLQMANCIGDPLQFVDWEYAQVADPAYDMACLLTYYPALGRHRGVLLAASGLDGVEDGRRLDAQQRVFAILDRLWTLAQPICAG